MSTPHVISLAPSPIAWRLQRFGDARAQVLQDSGAAGAAPRHVPARAARSDQDGGDEYGIQPVGLGPGQEMVRRTVSQRRVDLPRAVRRSTMKAGFHGSGGLQGSCGAGGAGSPSRASTSAAAARLRSPGGR